MCKLLAKLKVVKIEKSKIIDYENQVLLVLDFSIRNIGSINFLERYLRLFGLDRGVENSV